jgi:hypothetical protein
MRVISTVVVAPRVVVRAADATLRGRRRRRGCRERSLPLETRQHSTRKVTTTASSGDDAADDLVSKLRRGETERSSTPSVDDGADADARGRRARRRENRERDAATKAVLALALGAASMMPTVTTEPPIPSPVVSGAKRTVVAGAVKNAASDARGGGDERAALNAFERDVGRFVGGSINL